MGVSQNYMNTIREKLSVYIVREYNLYQWEAQLKVIAEIVGEAQVFLTGKATGRRFEQ